MFYVVSLMREPAGILHRFTAYYRRHGAERIVIYFDGTPPVTAADLGPGVDLIPVDDAFKARNRSGNPKDLIATQHMIFTAEHREARAPWMLVVDGDEYVHLPGGRLADLFGRIPSEVESVRFPTGEAVWGPGDVFGSEFGQTHFRLPVHRLVAPALERLLYGRSAPLFMRGLLGHGIGKHAIRTSVPVDHVRVHFSTRGGQRLGVWAASPSVGAPEAFLAHFDAITYDRWEEKWMRRHTGAVAVTGMSRARSRQVGAAAQAIRDGHGRAAFERLYGLTPAQARVLGMLGRLRQTTVF